MKRKTKIVYYSDPLNDDFAGKKIEPKKKVDKNYKFIHKNVVWKFFEWIVYYLIVYPIVVVYTRLILRVKFHNLKAVRKLKGNCYIYGNHTGYTDAFVPNIMSWPSRNSIVVSPSSVSIKGIKTLVEMLGALPIPQTADGMREFLSAMKYYQERRNITIYPEAHIWIYYTGVRPFLDKSFAYPVRAGMPVVAFFTAFKKPKGLFKCFRKANREVYVSDPIYPNAELPIKEAQRELRDKVYNFMCEMSKQHSDYEVVKYVYKNDELTQ